MRFLWTLPIACTLAGCFATAAPPVQEAAFPSPPPERHTIVKLDRADVAAVQAGARAAMKDPDSAKFGRMIAGSDSKGEIVVCLMVNAKNSYGGYTGEKPYMGILVRDKKPVKFIVAPADDKFPQYRDEAVYKVCSDYGLSPA